MRGDFAQKVAADRVEEADHTVARPGGDARAIGRPGDGVEPALFGGRDQLAGVLVGQTIEVDAPALVLRLRPALVEAAGQRQNRAVG